MSAVLDRVGEKTKSFAEDSFTEKLTTLPLSKLMRKESWGDHARAEYSDFEQSLVKGTTPKDAYAAMMAQNLAIYTALEERAAELADDPVAGSVITDVLSRKAAVEADLAFYYGDDWASKIEILPVTTEYAERIRTADPARYVAHHYVRYLADLSGGFMIDKGISAAYGLELDGRRYYVFDQIPDAVEFKKNYRESLDALPLDDEGKRALVEEVVTAYEYNIELIAVLEEKYLKATAS